MATAFQKSYNFAQSLGLGMIDMATDTFKVMLTDTAPVATDAYHASIVEIAAGNGYTAGGTAMTGTGWTNTSGVWSLSGSNVVFTAVTANIAQFRYAVLYDATAVSRPPVQSAPSTATTGGSIAAGTYYYVVTATTAAGESVVSNQESIATTGSASTVTVNWAQSPGAAGYKVYRSTTSGSYTGSALVGTIASGTTLTYTDTAASPSAGAPPSTNTAACGPIAGWWDYGAEVNVTAGNTFSVLPANTTDILQLS